MGVSLAEPPRAARELGSREIADARRLARLAGVELGAGVTLIHFDEGWRLDHPAFRPFLNQGGSIEWFGQGAIDSGRAAHGTAVLAMQIGARDGEPALPGARIVLAQAINDEGLPVGHYLERAIEATTGAAVVLIARDWSSRAPHIPLELRPGMAPVIARAVERGFTVVEAAGNGGLDLDRLVRRDGSGVAGQISLAGDPWMRSDDTVSPALIEDSRAIVVGATSGDDAPTRWTSGFPTNPQPRSNYGRRVDCWAAGEGVATASLDARGGATWTTRFGGTSAAAATIATFLATVQSLALHSGSSLPPDALRAALRDPANGIPVRDGGRWIGTSPRLRTLIESLPPG